jgi:hypothetical protein
MDKSSCVLNVDAGFKVRTKERRKINEKARVRRKAQETNVC